MPSASVFFGENEFLIIPSAQNEIGAWTDVNEPERLKWDGSSVVELGEKILKSLTVSKNSVGPPIGQKPEVFELATGAKSWRVFAKSRQMVNIETDDQDRLQVEFWRRNASFTYMPDPNNPKWTVKLPPDASAEAVGGAVIQVLRAANIAGV